MKTCSSPDPKEMQWGEEWRVVVTVGKKLILLLGFLGASAPLSLGGFLSSGNLVSSYLEREEPASPASLQFWIKSSIPGEEREVPPTLPFSCVDLEMSGFYSVPVTQGVSSSLWARPSLWAVGQPAVPLLPHLGKARKSTVHILPLIWFAALCHGFGKEDTPFTRIASP